MSGASSKRAARSKSRRASSSNSGQRVDAAHEAGGEVGAALPPDRDRPARGQHDDEGDALVRRERRQQPGVPVLDVGDHQSLGLAREPDAAEVAGADHDEVRRLARLDRITRSEPDLVAPARVESAAPTSVSPSVAVSEPCADGPVALDASREPRARRVRRPVTLAWPAS